MITSFIYYIVDMILLIYFKISHIYDGNRSLEIEMMKVPLTNKIDR